MLERVWRKGNPLALLEYKLIQPLRRTVWRFLEKLGIKLSYDPNNHDGVITHPEPNIPDCEVKWASGSITTSKANGGDGIPVELLQILKDDALNMPAYLENSAVVTGLQKVSFHSNPKERQCQRMFKLLHNCTQLTR